MVSIGTPGLCSIAGGGGAGVRGRIRTIHELLDELDPMLMHRVRKQKVVRLDDFRAKVKD
jgi:hypothetical protein